MPRVDNQLLSNFHARAFGNEGESSPQGATRVIDGSMVDPNLSSFRHRSLETSADVSRLFSARESEVSAERMSVDGLRTNGQEEYSQRVANPALSILEPIENFGPFGRIILDFEADKKTWPCHWFPMQETRPDGDPINNLYAHGGPLDKFDMVTGRNAREYEYQNYRKAVDAGSKYGWWGHCNNSAEAACLLEAPKHSVVMYDRDGNRVKFSTIDIQGLLVKMMPSLVDRVDFRGVRFNDPKRDDPNEPSPEVFIDVMHAWAEDGMPFVLDIDRKGQVWNFPYDRVRISESLNPPEGFDSRDMPNDGSVRYYHIEMSGTGFDDKQRLYQCYIERALDGTVIDSGWIKTPMSHHNPDFMWRPHPVGDLRDRASWINDKPLNNPEIDPNLVYFIYMQSLT